MHVPRTYGFSEKLPKPTNYVLKIPFYIFLAFEFWCRYFTA